MENIIIILFLSCIVGITLYGIMVLISIREFRKEMTESFMKISENQKKIYSDILKIKNR